MIQTTIKPFLWNPTIATYHKPLDVNQIAWGDIVEYQLGGVRRLFGSTYRTTTTSNNGEIDLSNLRLAGQVSGKPGETDLVYLGSVSGAQTLPVAMNHEGAPLLFMKYFKVTPQSTQAPVDEPTATEFPIAGTLVALGAYFVGAGNAEFVRAGTGTATVNTTSTDIMVAIPSASGNHVLGAVVDGWYMLRRKPDGTWVRGAFVLVRVDLDRVL